MMDKSSRTECRLCGHVAAYHGAGFCVHESGAGRTRTCDCPGWAATPTVAPARWGVYSYDDDRWYLSDPPTQKAASASRDLLAADGEACRLVDEATGMAMQNAANWARRKVLRQQPPTGAPPVAPLQEDATPPQEVAP